MCTLSKRQKLGKAIITPLNLCESLADLVICTGAVYLATLRDFLLFDAFCFYPYTGFIVFILNYCFNRASIGWI